MFVIKITIVFTVLLPKRNLRRKENIVFASHILPSWGKIISHSSFLCLLTRRITWEWVAAAVDESAWKTFTNKVEVWGEIEKEYKNCKCTQFTIIFLDRQLIHICFSQLCLHMQKLLLFYTFFFQYFTCSLLLINVFLVLSICRVAVNPRLKRSGDKNSQQCRMSSMSSGWFAWNGTQSAVYILHIANTAWEEAQNAAEKTLILISLLRKI